MAEAEQVRTDLEHLQAHVDLDQTRTRTAWLRARASCWTALGVTMMLSVPAAVIFVYAALWRWMQG